MIRLGLVLAMALLGNSTIIYPAVYPASVRGALTKLEQCSPQVRIFIIANVQEIQVKPSTTLSGGASVMHPGIVILDETAFVHGNVYVAAILAHEAYHAWQFRDPLNRILILFPAHANRLEADAVEYTRLVWDNCY